MASIRMTPSLPGPAMARLLAFVLAALACSGCAVQRTAVQEGRPFPVERIPEFDAGWRAGLQRDDVRRMFGRPYATGIDADGNAYWEYRQRGQVTTSGGGGLLLVGVVASQAAAGAEIRVVFDAMGTVRQVVWEIAGADAYRMLAGSLAR